MKHERRAVPQRVPTQRRASVGPIIFRTNVIFQIEGKTVFLEMGKPSPFFDVSDVPAQLQNVIASEVEAEEPNEPRGMFELNTPYLVTSEGKLGREVRRQAAELTAEAEFEDEIEEQIEAQSELPPAIAASLDDEHRQHVDMQLAQARASAERSDEITDAAIEASQPPQLFVKRGRNLVEVHRVHLRADEGVYVRDPDDENAFQFVGRTDGRAELPDLPITT